MTLPEGTEVEVLARGEGVEVDDATAAELAEAMKEADSEEGVPAEDVFAVLAPAGEELEAELRVVSDGQPDERTVQKLMAALKEADAGDFVEDVWARIKARRRE